MNDTTEILAETTAESPEGATTESHPDVAADQRPRVRIGAVVWGLVVTISVLITLAIVLDPVRSAGFAGWMGEVSAESIGLIALVAAGSLLLLLGLVSLLRQAQRRGERGRG